MDTYKWEVSEGIGTVCVPRAFRDFSAGLRIRIRQNPHYFSKKLDPDPELRWIFRSALGAQDEAVDAHNGGVEAHNRTLEGLYVSHWSQIDSL
jgi:hypothetical protein